MKKNILLITISILLFSCDIKKTSIAGKVINKATGQGLNGVTVSFIQCKVDGDNCNELVIGQAVTNLNGEFIIDKKTASKTKRKWITVYAGTKKIAEQNDIGINDKNIVVEANP